MFFTFANILTLFRILLIPFLIIAFYIGSEKARLISALIFIIGCITDYLDGYVARHWSQISRFGQFLDPVADKLLVATTLLLLAGFGRISTYSLIPALTILNREILVSGLREHLSDINITIDVSTSAQWKTAVQMVAISLLLIGDVKNSMNSVMILGEIMLWIASILTIITGYAYVKKSIRYF